MRFAAAIAFFASMLLLHATPAIAEKRVALVIGNANYINASALNNPMHDAAAIAALFKRVGYEVVERTNVNFSEMRRAIGDFSDAARGADTAVVYYSGHGIEVDGSNYLIPIDAVLNRDIDVRYETYSLDDLVKLLEPVKRLRVVILDACRDNPFTRTMRRTVGSRAVGRGLAAVDLAGQNTLIGFATRAGTTASDGEGNNSPYAIALLKHIATPGVEINRLFRLVRDDVVEATAGRQEPFTYGSLPGREDFFFVAK